MRLLEPLTLRGRTARNRIVFGPHETNLARGRAVSERHVAYYRWRAAGGAGIVVIEEASVHDSDWPYERAPLAAESASGWSAVARACHGEGALAIAALGHAGGQGTSAYSQTALWAPSPIPEVNTREVPKWMEKGDIDAVIGGFRTAATWATEAGCDGVEVNAGQHSLIRQFLSGLTNQRVDEWGSDRLRFAREVLTAVRTGAGDDAVVGLRLSCDELAPWAGVTPEAAVEIALILAELADYLTVVRGSIYSVSATRPDAHAEPGFNREVAGRIRAALPQEVAVVLQGSVVDVTAAESALRDGLCDAVEMTRAQIADPDLAAKAARGETLRVRPCILCNQTCQVRDNRNPLVSCVAEPSAGHERDDPPVIAQASDEPLDVLVVGAGVAGLECARVASLAGHRVTVAERSPRPGGMLRIAARAAGRARLALLVDWLAAECEHLGVRIETGIDAGPRHVAEHRGPVVLCTGSRPGRRAYRVDAGAVVRDADEVLVLRDALPDGPVVIWDPIGGPIAISVAETLRAGGRTVTLVSPDVIVGTQLSRSGDLAPANVRLQSAGIELVRRSALTAVTPDGVTVTDHYSARSVTLAACCLVDAGPRLPDDRLWRATGERLERAGDAVAPRTAYEAVLEGRRAAQRLTPTAGAAR